MELSEIQRAIEALPAEGRRALLVWLRNMETPEVPPPPKPAPKAAPKPKRPATLKSAVLWSVLSIVVFLLADAAIFRSGWYYNYLEPNSTAGQLESHLFWVRHTLPANVPEVAIVGDSRIAEGFSARKAAAVVGDKLRFWNLGVAGSTPRAWYYLLRDADPTRKRFKAIALGIDHYSDEDSGENVSNRLTDLNYLIGRLRLTDCYDFSRSFNDPLLQRPVLTGCLFKAVTLKRDIQGLLSNRKERFTLAKDWRNNGHGYIDGYGGKPEVLTGLTADFEKRTISFPPDTKDWQRATATSTVLPTEVPQTGALTAYRKLWMGRVLDLYKDSPTQIVFLELPRAPLPVPDLKAPPRFIQSVMNRPRLTILPKEMFRDLEHPDVFADGLHLNRVGRDIFSARLGEKIAGILGAGH